MASAHRCGLSDCPGKDFPTLIAFPCHQAFNADLTEEARRDMLILAAQNTLAISALALLKGYLDGNLSPKDARESKRRIAMAFRQIRRASYSDWQILLFTLVANLAPGPCISCVEQALEKMKEKEFELLAPVIGPPKARADEAIRLFRNCCYHDLWPKSVLAEILPHYLSILKHMFSCFEHLKKCDFRPGMGEKAHNP